MEGLYFTSSSSRSGRVPALLDLLNVRGHAFADAGDRPEFLGVAGDLLRAVVMIQQLLLQFGRSGCGMDLRRIFRAGRRFPRAGRLWRGYPCWDYRFLGTRD